MPFILGGLRKFTPCLNIFKEMGPYERVRFFRATGDMGRFKPRKMKGIYVTLSNRLTNL